ncbi:hypothetical protein ACHAQA_001382 [Verticillium albo-atrum]
MHKLFPNSPFFDFETIRILGTTVYGGADAAEVLEAVGQIKANDPLSWEKAWGLQAERAEALADEARLNGDLDAARRAYLRAANYARASGYMYVSSVSSAPGHYGDGGGDGPAMVQDPRALPAAEKVGELFRKALPLMDGPVLTLSVPYEDFALPAYLYLPPADRRIAGREKIPILVNCGGADSCQEELFFLNPAAGPGMGYAVLTFDGPGQGMMLRRHGLEMRPDWEEVTGCVIDHIVDFSAQNPDLNLDIDSISVSGASMGGYFALRAAADPRIKACVSIDPFYDMWDFGTAHVSPLFISAWTNGWIGQGLIDSIMGVLKRASFQLRWEISVTGTFFGLSSPAEILLHMKKFTFAGGGKDGQTFLSRVTCPVLVSGAGQSLYMDVDNHTRRCFEGLTNVPLQSKEIWVPSNPSKWCYIAKRNLDAAISLYQKTYPGGKHDTFAITWTPYYLNYNPHPHSVDKLALADVRLADHTPEQRAALTKRMNQAGLASGIQFNWGGQLGPNPATRDAHRLVHLVGASASGHGKYDGETQHNLVEAIFEAYHCRAQDVALHDVLSASAQRAGINAADVEAWLQSGEAGDVVDGEAERSKAAMAHEGVPALVIQKEHRPGGIPDVMDLMEIFIRVKETQS